MHLVTVFQGHPVAQSYCRRCFCAPVRLHYTAPSQFLVAYYRNGLCIARLHHFSSLRPILYLSLGVSAPGNQARALLMMLVRFNRSWVA